MMGATINTEFSAQTNAPLLNDKMKFSIKAAASLVLVYLIAFSQGWSNVSTAATTVMLIAAVGSLENAVMNGMLRVIGSVIGAVIGIGLVILFPQERFLYLLALSLMVTFVFHLARTYKGDMTVFMLTGMTMMLMFQNGNTDNVFLYGVNKAYMTLFAIAVYTLVGIIIWPYSGKKAEFRHAKALSKALKTRYEHRFEDEKKRYALHNEALQAQQTLAKSIPQISGVMEESFSPAQWRSLLRDFKELDTLLSLLPASRELSQLPKPTSHYLKGYESVRNQIEMLFNAIIDGWEDKKHIDIPPKAELSVIFEAAQPLSQLERATLGALALETRNLHALLSRIAEKLNALHRSEPTQFNNDKPVHTHAFDLLDPEHLKAALITFLVFWAGVVFWIYFNPPGGFMVVTLATGLSVITAFSPIKPSQLIIIFTISFIVTTVAYIGILPHLNNGFELTLFLFIYGFIGFYFLPAEVSIFFLMGLVTMNIANQMYYAFDIFLLILTMFYAFLSLLLLFYYLPFSTKPEHLFLILQKRFFTQSLQMVRYDLALLNGTYPLFQKILARHSARYLMSTVTKMKLWANQIDTNYFNDIDKDGLLAYVYSCERFATLLMMNTGTIEKQQANPLIRAYVLEQDYTALSTQLHMLKLPTTSKEKSVAVPTDKAFEEKLNTFFARQDMHRYEQQTIVSFYEILSFYQHIWRTLLDCKHKMTSMDFTSLKESRF